jgi:aminopeptidase YwaD
MKTLTNRLAGLLTLLWVTVMLVLTLTPAKEMPRTPEWKFLSFDTAAHAGVFAVLAALAWLWVRSRRRHPASWVLLGCIVFGALIEVLQYFMHLGRHAEWTDLLSDTIGAALVLTGASLAGRGRRLGVGAGLALLLMPGRAPAQTNEEPDLARVHRTIEELASAKMHGRGYVQQGEHKAAAYLRSRLRQLGLAPLAPDFTQPFTLNVNTFPGKAELTLAGTPPILLLPGRDFIAAPESGPWLLAQQFQAVLLDTLIFSDSTAWHQYLRPYTYSNGARPKPSPATIARLSQALVIRSHDEARIAHLPPALQQYIAGRPHFTLVPKLTASLAAEQARYPHLEVLATSWPVNLSPQLFTLKLDAQLLHNYPTQNLAAIIRGSAQPDSFLVVSAHYDHLGMMGKKTYFPGANDNASGVALLLELAAHYARPENRPAYSVVFLLFGAEEAGLVGSSYFVQHPLMPLARIKFLLNLDLLGTGEEGATVVNGRVYETAFRQLTALNDAHHYLPRLTARGRAANSDHFPFSEAGVPAFFLYTRGGSLAYHDVNDRPAALSLAGFTSAFGLARDFLDGLGAH